MIEFAEKNIEGGLALGVAIVAEAPPLAIITAAGITVYRASEKLIDACKEYNKVIELKNAEKGLDKFGNPVAIENDCNNTHEIAYDRDSWDREY